jgi:hypothetical protein
MFAVVSHQVLWRCLMRKLNSNKFVRLILIAILTLFIIAACHSSSSVEYNYDKQAAFETLFAKGLSRQEVEMIIEGLEDVTYDGEMQRIGGGVSVFYRTSIELYGTFGYTFVYNDDLKLLHVTPQFATD